MCHAGGGADADPAASPPQRPSDLVSALHLSRLFFVVGHTALQHLVRDGGCRV